VRWVRRIAAVVIVVLVVIVVPLVGWSVASMSLHPSHAPTPYNVGVVSLQGDHIELQRLAGSADPGVYRLE